MIRKKTIMLLFVVVLVVISCFFTFSLFFGEKIEYDLPEISLIDTASSVNNIGDWTQEFAFIPGDKIHIYLEYLNVSHPTGCDFFINVSIIDPQNNECFYREDNITTPEKGCTYSFNTDLNWKKGAYLVKVFLFDRISKKSAEATTIFLLI